MLSIDNLNNEDMKKLNRVLSIAVLIVTLFSTSCTSEKTYQVGEISTPLGDVWVWLYDETPKHKEAFIELATSGYWNDYTFNRVIENFVAQGGCPDTPEGFAYSIHLLEPEFNPDLQHVHGALGAGRDNNPKMLSAACQFYIVQNKDGLHRLDNAYTIYGQVIKGMDVVEQIVRVPKDSLNQPIEDINLQVKMIELTRKEVEATGFDVETYQIKKP